MLIYSLSTIILHPCDFQNFVIGSFFIDFLAHLKLNSRMLFKGFNRSLNQSSCVKRSLRFSWRIRPLTFMVKFFSLVLMQRYKCNPIFKLNIKQNEWCMCLLIVANRFCSEVFWNLAALPTSAGY
jgi:hypothetical protein